MPADTTPAPSRSSRLHQPVRGRTTLSHAIYGLILMVAELGELLEYRVEPSEAALWLLAGGLALLLVHVYSGTLGTAAMSQSPVSVRTVTEQFVEEGPVAVGFAAAAIVLLSTGAVGFDLAVSYGISIAAALIALGGLGALAVVHRPTLPRRLGAGAMTAAIGGLVVALESALG